MALRTILIGLGRIAWRLEFDRLRYHPCTHAGTIKKLLSENSNSFSLIGVADSSDLRIAEFQKWWRIPLTHRANDFRQILEKEIPDLAVVCTPTENHFETASGLIRSGVPNIILEKPAAETHVEVRKLRQLAEKNRSRIWINFERRYHPGYRRIKEAVFSKKYGAIRSIEGKVLTGEPGKKSRIGPLLHDGVHWIDLLIWLAGKPDRVHSRILKNPHAKIEHTVFADFHYRQFQARLEAGGRRRYFDFSMAVDFEYARFESGNSGHRFWKTEISKRYENFRELREQKLPGAKINPWIQMYREILLEANKKIQSKKEYDSAIQLITSGISDSELNLKIIQQCFQ